MDTKDGILTQRHAVDQPDSAFRQSQQRHKGAADERAVVDRVLLTSNDDAQVCCQAPAQMSDAEVECGPATSAAAMITGMYDAALVNVPAALWI